MPISKISNVNAIDAGTVNQAALTTGVAGTGPAFSAYATGSQSITGAVFTKIALNNELYDTNNNFDSTTNYRFTPTVAGYYQINGGVVCGSGTTSLITICLYKNGVNAFNGPQFTGSTVYVLTTSSLIYCNGTTDYIELYIYSSVGLTINGAASNTYLNGSMVRGA